MFLLAAGVSCISPAVKDIPFPEDQYFTDGDQTLLLRDYDPEENTLPGNTDGSDRKRKQEKRERVPEQAVSQNLNSSNAPDDKGRPVRTDFFGAELIREIVNIEGADITRITLRGNATVVHNKTVLRAPSIRIDGGSIGLLTGGITVEDKESGTIIRAARADYSRQEQKVVLSGLPSITARMDDGRTALITSVKMIQDLAQKTSYLEGDLRIIHEKSTLIGDKGIFHNDTKLLEIEKNSVFIGPDHYLSGKRILYSMEARTLDIADHPVVLLRSDDTDILPVGNPADSEEDEALPEKKKEKVTAAVSAENIRYTMKTDYNPEPKLEMLGSVVITRKGFTLKAPSLKTEGESLRYFTGRESVDVTDLDQNVRMRSQVMIYDRENSFMRMEENGQIDFLDKETKEITGNLKAAVIETDMKERITRARGGVRLSNAEYTATAEQAYYKESDKVIILEGNPGLESGKSTVYSEKILIYPETGQIKMESGLRGQFSRD